MGKRAFDIVLAVIGIFLTWPLMLVAALAVKVDSPGPVLFRQERVGRNGTHFKINKFRSMRVGGVGPFVTTVGDSRVTRVGRILRATKLDELPQFWNVLVGHMSVVGPRPEVPHFVSRWPDHERRLILSVRPGITGLASVEFRRESELIPSCADAHDFYFSVLMPAKNALSQAYVLRRSMWFDLRIIFRTVHAVLLSRWSKHVAGQITRPATEAEELTQASPRGSFGVGAERPQRSTPSPQAGAA